LNRSKKREDRGQKRGKVDLVVPACFADVWRKNIGICAIRVLNRLLGCIGKLSADNYRPSATSPPQNQGFAGGLVAEKETSKGRERSILYFAECFLLPFLPSAFSILFSPWFPQSLGFAGWIRHKNSEPAKAHRCALLRVRQLSPRQNAGIVVFLPRIRQKNPAHPLRLRL